jgi:hypothetical protein
MKYKRKGTAQLAVRPYDNQRSSMTNDFSLYLISIRQNQAIDAIRKVGI